MRTVPNARDGSAAADPPPIPDGITHWHGHATGLWWAIVPGQQGPRLVEAPSEDHLAETVAWHLRAAKW